MAYRIGCAFIVLVLVIGTRPARCQSILATQPTVGRQRVRFTQSSPLSGLAEYCRRTRQSTGAYEREGREHEYTVAEESFELFVPEGYRDDGSYGLLVWVSPGKAGLPEDWFGVLERHKLVWICPNEAGNGRHFIVRIGLALDAVHNMQTTHKLDPTRVYASGFSGGGRVSSILILTYPDVFTAAVPMMGSNFYRHLPAGDGKLFQAGASKPIDVLFAKAKQRPIVLFTGERDGNQPQTKSNYEAMQKDRFAHVSYIEVPGVGHNMPGADWFEKALTDLDVAVAASAAATRPATKPITRRSGGSTSRPITPPRPRPIR
jgi:predicted esterase